MGKFKKFLRPIGIVGLLMAATVGAGCTIDEQITTNPSLGEIFDPTGNPFAHRFTDEGVTPYGNPTDGQIAIWTDADTVEGASASFTATVIVAANNATGAEKVAALASGGTVCNNSSDETDINAVLVAGTHVILSSGTFTVDGSITAAINNVTIEGQGMQRTIIALEGIADVYPIQVGGDGWQLKNFTVDGNNEGTSYYAGILIDNKDDGVLESVEVTDMCDTYNAITVTGTSPSRWLFHKIYVHDNRYNGYLDTATASYDITVTDSQFITNGTSGEFGGLCVQGTIAYRYIIADCIFSNNTYRQRFDNLRDSIISDCISYKSCFQAQNDGAWSLQSCEHTTLNNVSAIECGGVGIQLIDSPYCEVNNPHIEGQRGYGIGISGTSHHSSVNDGLILNCGDVTQSRGVDLCSDDITIDGLRVIDDTGTPIMDYGILSFGDAERASIKNVWIEDMSANGIASAGLGNDDWQIRSFTVLDCGADGISASDGDDYQIIDGRIKGCNIPIDVNNAAVVRPMIMGVNWEGCTNDASYASATNPRITANIDKDGAWWTTGDSPS